MNMVRIRKLRMAAERLERAEVAVARATLALSKLSDDGAWMRISNAESRVEDALRERALASNCLSAAWARYESPC